MGRGVDAEHTPATASIGAPVTRLHFLNYPIVTFRVFRPKEAIFGQSRLTARQTAD